MNLRRLFMLLAVLIGIALPLCAQAPAADARANCNASGTVINAYTGEPVPRAMVTLRITSPATPPDDDSGPSPSPMGAATDAAGRWSIANTNCGTATPAASRPGFSHTTGKGASIPLQLQSGFPLRDIKITLTPDGAIAGRVQDDEGDPITSITVDTLRVAVVNGKRTLVNVGYTQVDGQGNFWLGGLPAGRYIACASSSKLSYPVGGGAPRVYAKDCFPSMPDAGPSAAMLVKGTEVRATLTLHKAQSSQVRGKVTGAQGVAARVQLIGEPGDPYHGTAGGLNYARFAITAPDGTFDIVGVPAGSWVVTCQLGDEAKTLFGETNIDVRAADVNDVAVNLRPLGAITGTVSFEKSKPRPSDVSVDLLNLNGFNFTDAHWDAAHQHFTIHTGPGQYLLRATAGESDYHPETRTTNPNDWVKSVTVSGRDILDQPFTLDSSLGPVEIVISEDKSDADIAVTDADGKPVLADVILVSFSGQGSVVRTGPEGHAVKHGIPPGDYQVWAFEDAANIPWAEPEWMRQNAGPPAKITISVGATAAVSVTRAAVPPE